MEPTIFTKVMILCLILALLLIYARRAFASSLAFFCISGCMLASGVIAALFLTYMQHQGLIIVDVTEEQAQYDLFVADDDSLGVKQNAVVIKVFSHVYEVSGAPVMALIQARDRFTGAFEVESGPPTNYGPVELVR